MISGDQHLSTFSHLGIERPSDAVYQFCVSALANIFWRWFYPNSVEDPQGEFVDAWGNYFRMIVVANPERQELLNRKLRQRYVIPKQKRREVWVIRNVPVLVTDMGSFDLVKYNKRSQLNAGCTM